VSPILTTLAAAAGGVLTGLVLAGLVLHRQHHRLTHALAEARRDHLTGLPNRRALFEHLCTMVRAGGPVGVVLLDLDRFKTLNDALGHDAGDDLLRQVAARLCRLDRPVRMAARLGGDEFVLVVHGHSDDVRAAAHAARQAVAARPYAIRGHSLNARASAGYATGRPGVSERQLLRDADRAMYRAKTTGAGVHAHTPGTDERPFPTRPTHRVRDRRHH